jgi:hypothetical protein
MKKSYTRRSFLKTNLQAGLASVAVTSLFPEIIKNIMPAGERTEQKKGTGYGR